jgi:hypothetical protein
VSYRWDLVVFPVVKHAAKQRPAQNSGARFFSQGRLRNLGKRDGKGMVGRGMVGGGMDDIAPQIGEKRFCLDMALTLQIIPNHSRAIHSFADRGGLVKLRSFV